MSTRRAAAPVVMSWPGKAVSKEKHGGSKPGPTQEAAEAPTRGC